jgi:hypothetical protein
LAIFAILIVDLVYEEAYCLVTAGSDWSRVDESKVSPVSFGKVALTGVDLPALGVESESDTGVGVEAT